MELVDDPLVLEAALALVDEWCADAAKDKEVGKRGTPTATTVASVASMSPHSLRKRAREELTWLRSSVQQLHERAAAKHLHYPHPRAIPVYSSDKCTESEGNGEESGGEIVAPAQRRAKARRLLHAVHTYNRVRAATRLTFGFGGSQTFRPVDDERILATLRSRLDALAQIAHTNRVLQSVIATSPTLTGSGLRAQTRASYVLPFKLSQVSDVMWEMAIEGFHEEQQSAVKPDEVFTMVESSHETPWGAIASSGRIAWRRTYQPDGSVVELYTSIGTGTRTRSGDGEAPNLLAGCVVKQAGWTRIARAPDYNGVSADRPLVLVEIWQSLVVEALPGYCASRDRLLRFWDAVMAPSNQQGGSRLALENRLMDRQLTTKA